MGWKDKITGPELTTGTQFGGVTLNAVLDYFSAFDHTVGGTLPGENVDINTETLFATNKLKLWDSNKSHKITLQTPDYLEDKTLTFPNEAEMGATDQFVFKDTVQTLTGKVLDFTTNNTAQNIPKSAISAPAIFTDQDNSLGAHHLDIAQFTPLANPASGTRRVHVDPTSGKLSVRRSDGSTISLEEGALSGAGGFAAGGTATKSGAIGVNQFTIAHGLSVTPDIVVVWPSSVDAASAYQLDKDDTNITITYNTPPPADTNNLEFIWGAAYVNPDVITFTPSSIDTLTNKTIDADANTITNIENADIKAAAGIVYSKLNLTDSIVNADINSSAAIAWSKISKVGSLLTDMADIQITNLQNNQALTWDSTLSKWVNEIVSGGGGGGGIAAGGLATKSGDAINKVFTITHSLGQIPDVVTVHPRSTDALGSYIVSKDSTTITVTYQIAPPSGTNNVLFEWGAAFVGSVEIGAKSGFAAGGVISKSGTGSQTVFTIAHGLVPQPEVYLVQAQSIDARGSFIVTVDTSNIIITYPEAPPTGTNNLTYVWGAGYVNEATAGLTPGSVTTLTNKAIGDSLKFLKQGSTPGDPLIEEAIVYVKAIDANNNGLFLKIKEQGAIVERRLFP